MGKTAVGGAFDEDSNGKQPGEGIDAVVSLPSGEKELIQFKSHYRAALLQESQYRCAICGSDVKEYLQIAHIKALYLGGSNKPENLMILCAACHAAVDSIPLEASILEEIKRDWADRGVLGAKHINQLLSALSKANRYPWTLMDPAGESFLQWAATLRANKTFDADIEEAQARLQAVKNEDEFIHTILRPLFLKLGFEGVTTLHHTGEHEHGKDMVFCARDRLGSFTVYAVVACCKKIHATSSKTSDAGHYAKLIDQVQKCYSIAWWDHRIKRNTFIDKVIIATPSTITDEAKIAFRSWEEMNRRQLIYLDYESLVGKMAELKPQH
jgi:hypothetical protein